MGKIVTDQLILCADAASRRSYIRGTTSWNDLVIPYGGSVGLFNGPVFSESKGGSILFDWVNPAYACSGSGFVYSIIVANPGF